FSVFREDLRAGRQLDDAVAAVGARAVFAHAGPAVFRREELLVAIVEQRVEIGDAFDVDIATLATVAAVRPAEFDKLLTPERDAAVAAGSGLYVDFRLIQKLHGASASNASVNGRRRTCINVGSSHRRASHQPLSFPAYLK